MGVDSGLGTFRGRNAGVWPPLKAMQLDFSEMSSPGWFTEDPLLAWAFWCFRYSSYAKSTPHEGYSILSRWGGSMKHGLFSVTSNIDGHWDRTDGVGPERVYEVHGAVTRMQPLTGQGIWTMDAKQLANCKAPAWDLRPGERVMGRTARGWVPAVVGEDGCSLLDEKGEAMRVGGVRRTDDDPDLCRLSADSKLPLTPDGRPARPNVLMFGDWGVDCRVIMRQQDAFQKWLRGLPQGSNLVVLEIGAGTAVRTIRSIAEEAGDRPNATLVRINLDQPNTKGKRAISVGGMGALEALNAIDNALCEIDPRFA